jgi:hypothetical protein
MVAFTVMTWGLRALSGRLAVTAMFAVLAGASMACGSLLGIDLGNPRGDASTFDADTLGDVAVDDDGSVGDDAQGSGEAGPVPDGGLRFDAAGCAPDLSWCNTHCGTGPDNCGVTRACPSQCPQGDTCSASNTCECTSDPDWCTGRCGEVTDNCGNNIGCPGCNGVSCLGGACGCMPDPVATTCAGKQCGQATNNCGLTVPCGVNSSTACASGEVCVAATDSCCTPNNAGACGTKCQVSVPNNCGQTIACPSTCPNNGVCLSGQCCTPTACGGNCVDNCGQPNSSCCQTTPPPDAGGGSGDAGGCVGPGVGCTTQTCCSSFCGYSGTCVTSCGGSHAFCSQNSDCCYGTTCSTSGIITQQLPISLDGAVINKGTCE